MLITPLGLAAGFLFIVLVACSFAAAKEDTMFVGVAELFGEPTRQRSTMHCHQLPYFAITGSKANGVCHDPGDYRRVG